MSGAVSNAEQWRPPHVDDLDAAGGGGADALSDAGGADRPAGPSAEPPAATVRTGETATHTSVLAALARRASEAVAAHAGELDRAAAADAPPHAGLPEVLLEAPSAVVIHGTDPGDFYCEHMFYVSQTEAARAGSSVLQNDAGERLVGFLHVPADAHTYSAGGAYEQAARHEGTRAVIGAAARGYYQDAVRAGAGDPVRLLLTGYDTFQSVVDNPTADFVTHPENLDAALRASFGERLLDACGEDRPGASADVRVRAYRVRDDDGQVRTLEVQLRRFPVTDEALDPRSARSVQHAMGTFEPHAVLAMGVSGASTYLAEHHADMGRLREHDGRYVHDPARAPDDGLPSNYSLARALVRGTSAPIA